MDRRNFIKVSGESGGWKQPKKLFEIDWFRFE